MTVQLGFPPEVKAGILIRDGGLCTMLGVDGCRGGKADEANHRLNRGMGGTSEAIVNSPSNGCALEHGCNWRLDQSAEFAEAGRRRGVKLVQGADPVHVPLWSPFFRQWLLLAPSGARLSGVTDASLDARESDRWLDAQTRRSILGLVAH